MLTRKTSDFADNDNSVCIRDAKEAFSVRPRFPESFIYLTLDVEDNEEQNLIRLFPQYVLGDCCPLPSHNGLTSCLRAKLFIDNALNTGGRVLVHCNGTKPSSH